MDTAVQEKPLTFKDFKSDYKPVWCPGCGDFSVLVSVTKALLNAWLNLAGLVWYTAMKRGDEAFYRYLDGI